MIPRGWWKKDPTSDRAVGIEDSIAVIKEVLQKRRFDVSGLSFSLFVAVDCGLAVEGRVFVEEGCASVAEGHELTDMDLSGCAGIQVIRVNAVQSHPF